MALTKKDLLAIQKTLLPKIEELLLPKLKVTLLPNLETSLISKMERRFVTQVEFRSFREEMLEFKDAMLRFQKDAMNHFDALFKSIETFRQEATIGRMDARRMEGRIDKLEHQATP